MIGAILGDIIGSPYEFTAHNYKAKDFPLFSERSQITDDTVMTIAVAEAIIGTCGGTDDEIKSAVVHSMRKFGKRYPYAGYGTHFTRWICQTNPVPYHSFGNGSAMRVSSVAWLYDTIDDVRRVAHLTAEVTHNHPEGIKGAESTAAAIFLSRKGHSKDYIRHYIEDEFSYNLSRTCDEIRPTYYHVESCQESVPEAITAFLEGDDFEDVIRTAISLGGDSGTIACIAGSIAEAFYGVPKQLREAGMRMLCDTCADLAKIYLTFMEATKWVTNPVSNPK